MKLIDLLVQELPKRGGWPQGAERASVGDFNGDSITVVFCFPRGYSNGFDVPFQYTVTIPIPGNYVGMAKDYCMITRDLYESALAASQKPAWNGEVVPPVGCECEYLDSNGKWYPVTIKYSSDQLVVISGVTKILGVEQGTEIAKDIIIDKPQFRPLRTEAKRKRDAVVEAIHWYMPEFIPDTPNKYYHAKKIYDAIAAGKIPGVKLHD